MQDKLRFHDTLESAREFVKEEGGTVDSTGFIAGTPFRVGLVSGKGALTENGKVPTSERIMEISDLLGFKKEFYFFGSDAEFWQKEGKATTRNYKVQRLDGDILNHDVQYDDIILVYSHSFGHTSQQMQLDVGEKVLMQVQKMFGGVPNDLYIAANLKPHIEIPELSRRFGLERADFWTIWKPQEPLNFFYKRYEHDEEKEKDVIVEARIEKGYAISYPWTLDWAYISIHPETFGYLRTKPMPYESWESVADDFELPPKEILTAREVTKRLLNGEPWKNFENVGVNITKPLGVNKYGYHWYARGIDVPWEQLKWEADKGIPENCRNLGYAQSYFLVSDEKEAFIIKSLEGVRFLEMPDSGYGALVVGDDDQAKEFRAKIRKEEEDMLNDDFVGYIVDKIEHDDFWYAIRVLPDGRYLLEEWSDSPNENDKWICESLDKCYNKAVELNPDDSYIIGQEVDYWELRDRMTSLGSVDSDHSLMTFKLMHDSESSEYFIIQDDASGQDEIFELAYYGKAEEVLNWLETTDNVPETSADILSMLVSQNENEITQ